MRSKLCPHCEDVWLLLNEEYYLTFEWARPDEYFKLFNLYKKKFNGN